MNGTVVQQLILKDCRLHRGQIILSITGGCIALAIFQLGGETAVVVGAVCLFIALAILGSTLPMSNIVNERKKQNLAFLMSLPVSSIQYSIGKLVSTVGMFLTPWLVLVIGAMWVIAGRGVLPAGTIPVTLVIVTLPLLGLCLICGVSLVGESEVLGNTSSAIVNSSYWLAWYMMARNPALTKDWKSTVAVWSPTVLIILAGEFALIALILGLTFYLQSRKRDFV